MPAKEILSESDNSTGPVQRQVKLPFVKSLEISIKSIKVRFFRSLITTLSLVLAVSFLSFVGVSNDIANGMLAKQDPELRRQLVRSGYDLEHGDTTVGSSPKQRWLVILSLLVCVVGAAADGCIPAFKVISRTNQLPTQFGILLGQHTVGNVVADPYKT